MNLGNIPNTILFGNDGRFRATGRVLIAGIVLIQLTVLFTTIMQPLLGITNNWWTMPVVGILQASAFVVLWVGVGRGSLTNARFLITDFHYQQHG